MSAAGAYEGEILQLAAYCLLVEERFGKPVRRGQLLYQNRSLEVLYDDRLRRKLLDAVTELKSAELMSDVPRSHNSPARCRGCGFRLTCRDSLASAYALGAMLDCSDMSKVQDLPPAAEVEMSEVRQGQDAEAKGKVRLVPHTNLFITTGRRWSRHQLRCRLSVAYR